MLAFGGSRTFHRIAVAIEDAGFELRDTIMWVYGCLSEDTEILTLDGWVRYDSPLTASPVVCYNNTNNTFEAHMPIRRFVYDNKYPAYHIKSDLTDQIVSRNHRVLVERDGKGVFQYAENLQETENIPILEGLHGLPETIYDFYSGTSIQKQDLLGTVQRQADFLAKEGQGETRGTKGLHPDNLCSMREAGVEAQLRPSAGSVANMQLPLQRGIKGARVGETRKQRESCLEQRVGTEIERENDGFFKSSVEGRGNIFQTTWELCRSQICQMSSRILADGKKRWIHNGTSANGSKANREAAVKRGSCASCQPSAIRQQIGESNALFEQSTSQVVRRGKQPSTTLATITPIEYDGKVWCVEVPTGAFVARRNGQIFITGNSGFPKSHDVSKAIDKEAGAERQVAGSIKKLQSYGWEGNNCYGGDADRNGLMQLTSPATPDAAKWQGWGSALKPAFEPIILARKPLENTIAANVLKWGTGAINVDGCRVGTTDNLSGGTYGGVFGAKRDEFGNLPKAIGSGDKGRWPANLLLGWPEDEYELKDNISADNLRQLAGWLDENPKL